MLSYRHDFHAGNHADVLKHIVLTEVLGYLTRKESPLWYIDTHAGIGQYRLDPRPPAGRAEWLDGIARLWEDEVVPASLGPYLARVRALNPDGRLRLYPGSPRVAADLLRPGDRAWLYELLGKDFQVLQEGFRDRRQIRCFEADGFAALKGLLPPAHRRGLIFIDPSYELKTDYQRLLDTLEDALRRFSSGCYLLWYPLVQRKEALELPTRLQQLQPAHWLRAELRVKAPPTRGYGLYGSGMFVVNPPRTLPTMLRDLLPWLKQRLAVDRHGDEVLEWHLP